jgi:hypothetical protein
MKRIEQYVQYMVDCYILEDFEICGECDVVNHEAFANRYYSEEDGCPMEEDPRCPKEILWFNSKQVADAIMNLECVKSSPVLSKYLNEELG